MIQVPGSAPIMSRWLGAAYAIQEFVHSAAIAAKGNRSLAFEMIPMPDKQAPRRPPAPETGGHRYLLEYRANIFARNFILSTKSTLVGGQLGGLNFERTEVLREFASEIRAGRFSGTRLVRY
jgi:hypothetical protein